MVRVVACTLLIYIGLSIAINLLASLANDYLIIRIARKISRTNIIEVGEGYTRIGVSASLSVNVVSVIKIFRRWNTEVNLIGMIHLGHKDFYTELKNRYGDPDILSLTEGVKDKNELMKGFGYQNLAELTGLTAQPKEIFFNQRNSDLDVSDLDPNVVGFLQELSGVLKDLSYKNLSKSKTISQWRDPEFQKAFHGEVNTKRTLHLLEELDPHLSSNRRVCIPWGSAHLDEVEESLIGKGFTLSQQDTLFVLKPIGPLFRLIKALRTDDTEVSGRKSRGD